MEQLEPRLLLSAVSFEAKVDLVSGSSPWSVTAADVNGDGKKDLITANEGSNTISVLMNNGVGEFAGKVDYATGTSPDSVVAADFNGDGKLDLAVTNLSSGTVSVLMNNGDGTFAGKVDYATASDPWSVTAADFNGDGKPDLAVANYGSNTVSVRLNNGDGTFAAKADYLTGNQPWSVTSADFNDDGNMDLAVANANSNTVSILLGNGNGAFGPKGDWATGLSPDFVTAADLNGDGNMDLAVANYTGGTVSILLGSGAATFAGKVDYATGSSPEAVTTGDFNGDGAMDLAVVNGSSDTVTVLTNSGAGTFAAKADFATGSQPWSVASADFNGDGSADLAVASTTSDTVNVFLNSYAFTPIVAVNSLITTNNMPTLTGTCAAGILGNTISSVSVVVGTQTLSATVTGSTWSVAVPDTLADGVYNVIATATDNAGNVGADTTTNELTVDTVAPVVTVNALVTNNNMPTLTGTVSDAVPSSGLLGVSVMVGTQTLPATVTGNTWSVAVPAALLDGVYDVTATATDVAGNVGTDATTNELTVDTVAPVVTVNSLVTKNNTPTLTGTVTDASPSSGIASVSAVVGTQTLAATVTGTTWSVAVPTALIDGTYDVQVTVTDNAGNVGTDATTNELTVDTVAPVVTVNSLVTTNNTPTLTGTVNDATPSSGLLGVSVVVGTQTLTATVTGSIWSVTVPVALADGVYNVTATATDNAGNVGVDATTNELTVSSLAPTDIAISNANTLEYQPIGTAVGSFTTADLAVGDTFTYTLVSGSGGADNGSFTIDGNTLKTNAVFDYPTKSSFSILVQSTNQNGLFTEKVFAINVVSNPVLSLTTPADSSAITEGQTYRIAWSGGTSTTTVQLWSYGPDGWNKIADNIPAGQTYYDWNTSAAPHGWYAFTAQVNPGNGGAWYMSNSPNQLNVVNPTNHTPTVTLTTSASAVEITKGATYNITWNSSDSDGDTLHVSLWAWSTDTGWFNISGAGWLEASAGSFAWNTAAQGHGWYSFVAHIWDGSVQSTSASPNWLHIVQPLSQMPTFTFTTPTSGQTVAHGSIFNLAWTATVPPEDASTMKVQLRACYLDPNNGNTPVWVQIASNLDPTSGQFAWDTTSLSTDHTWYSFGATLGYSDLWVMSASQYWLNVI